MSNSRREFVKKFTLGTTGVTLGNLNLQSNPYLNEFFNFPNSLFGRWNENKEDFSPVYPVPREANYYNDFFRLDENTIILLPQKSGKQDEFVAKLLISELAERYGLVLSLKKVSKLDGLKNYILIGSIKNLLINNFAQTFKIQISSTEPGPEGYVLKITKDAIGILGSDDQGAFYGLQSLRQLLNLYDARQVQCADIKDWPNMKFRGIRLNLPHQNDIIFYKRFLRDFMAYFKYNKVIVQVDAYMRFDRHPELNAGWIEYSKDKKYTRRTRITGPNGEAQDGNSSHGCIYEKEEIAGLVNYAGKYFIETIPEIPSLTHSYYLLTRHRELAEIKNAEWPDTYCPSNPDTYKLLFDVLDEYIEVMDPKIFHIGHDEWRMAMDICERCKGRDYSELFIQDVNKIYTYLKSKNIRTAIWGDHLTESHAGKGPQTITIKETGYTYRKPGAVPPEMVKTGIPKDILIFNWSWKAFKGRSGEKNTRDYEEWGFEQVYSNFEPYINDFERRSKVKGVIGGAPSVWSDTNELTIGKNKLYKLLGCANIMWSTHYQDEITLTRYIQHLTPSVRINLKGSLPPSKEGDPIISVDIRSAFNARKNDQPMGIPLEFLKTGMIQKNNISFDLKASPDTDDLCALVIANSGKQDSKLPMTSNKITINKDVSSLIFLHACVHPAENIYGHNKGISPEDTADLLGWYRVIYKDGYQLSIPVRYGLNIKEWHLWGIDPLTGMIDKCLVEPFCNGVGSYCYEGDPVNCSSSRDKGLYFFSYEWENTRPGTEIKEIYLEGSNKFEKWNNQIADNNAIALIALSYVEIRDAGRIRAK